MFFFHWPLHINDIVLVSPKRAPREVIGLLSVDHLFLLYLCQLEWRESLPYYVLVEIFEVSTVYLNSCTFSAIR